METVTFTVVVDNLAADGLVTEHGFSLSIKNGSRNILFDTGNKDALMPNAKALGLDLSEISDLVVSHGHYDHSGGVGAVLSQAQGVNIYMHQTAPQPRYKIEGDSAKSVAMPDRSLQSLDQGVRERINWVTGPIEISETVGITGPIPRSTGYEDTGGPFYFDQQGKHPDLIEDDIALWVRTPKGLVVCVGCSHAGIVNILEAVMEITGERKIHTVIGGLHLMLASGERLQKTVTALNTIAPGQLIACHCTGDKAVDFLDSNLECPVIRGYAGFSMTI